MAAFRKAKGEFYHFLHKFLMEKLVQDSCLNYVSIKNGNQAEFRCFLCLKTGENRLKLVCLQIFITKFFREGIFEVHAVIQGFLIIQIHEE